MHDDGKFVCSMTINETAYIIHTKKEFQKRYE